MGRERSKSRRRSKSRSRSRSRRGKSQTRKDRRSRSRPSKDEKKSSRVKSRSDSRSARRQKSKKEEEDRSRGKSKRDDSRGESKRSRSKRSKSKRSKSKRSRSKRSRSKRSRSKRSRSKRGEADEAKSRSRSRKPAKRLKAKEDERSRSNSRGKSKANGKEEKKSRDRGKREDEGDTKVRSSAKVLAEANSVSLARSTQDDLAMSSRAETSGAKDQTVKRKQTTGATAEGGSAINETGTKQESQAESRHADVQPDSAKIVEVPQELVGWVSGLRGENLRSIEEKASCKLQFVRAVEINPAAPPGKQVCCIRGPADRIALAEKLLGAKVKEVAELQAQKKQLEKQATTRRAMVAMANTHIPGGDPSFTKNNIPCKQLLQGSCSLGDQCAFSHDLDAIAAAIGDITEQLAAGSSSDALQPGVPVRIHSLQTLPSSELNGQEGIIEQWDASSRRWHVAMADGEIKALRPGNLAPLGSGKTIAADLSSRPVQSTKVIEAVHAAPTEATKKIIIEENVPMPQQAAKPKQAHEIIAEVTEEMVAAASRYKGMVFHELLAAMAEELVADWERLSPRPQQGVWEVPAQPAAQAAQQAPPPPPPPPQMMAAGQQFQVLLPLPPNGTPQASLAFPLAQSPQQGSAVLSAQPAPHGALLLPPAPGPPQVAW